MTRLSNRRRFLQTATALSTAAFSSGAMMSGVMSGAARAAEKTQKPLFELSLAQWSLHRALRGGQLDNLDFAKTSHELGINAVEYVNQFFKQKARDKKYLGEMKRRAEDLGVESVLIMVDGEGALGDADDAARKKAVENHFQWVEAAKFFGCHSIRVNARSSGDYDEQKKLAADGLRRLSEFAKPLGLNVIVENHGGLSSNGKWLSETIQAVELDNCGTLPDFGNFGDYDRYQGVRETMPYAKAVSAKSHDFDDQGNETHTDYLKMMKIVVEAGYRGYVGIEYEGKSMPEMEGIRATQKLLERVRTQLSS